MKFKVAIYVLLILFLNLYASVSLTQNFCHKNKLKSPSQYFDLSHWKLTIPTKKNNEITPNQLMAGYCSHYFYAGLNHSMVFWCRPKGTTKFTHYSRSELRERLNPNTDSKNWQVKNGIHVLSATLRVAASTTAPKVVVLQIHAYKKYAYAAPLLKVIWEKRSGDLAVEYKADGHAKIQKKVTIGMPHNAMFSCEIVVKHGILKVYYNGVLKFQHNVAYWKQPSYFKAGNYLQTTNPNLTGEVIFYHLKIEHY